MYEVFGRDRMRRFKSVGQAQRFLATHAAGTVFRSLGGVKLSIPRNWFAPAPSWAKLEALAEKELSTVSWSGFFVLCRVNGNR